ncbi:sodium:solute symporter family protein [Anoxynatronum buryatiense]|uniref:Solute:Na+ symporter, SSS family n=1 Tax=Anoxynatronum buryatiense TaxID=489973 RepID=A0AA45WTL4_9CLOT|nr:sodium:solute symporter family protein [Anoxynatronum buryatiense]SMP43761.1 solute:Na+ symporter, SSS family [Anoxynatronum buryatiense]
MTNNAIAIVIIGIFMLIPLSMGAIASKKSLPTTEDFFVQGRGMGSIAVFFTVAATWWSSFAFLGSNAFFYTRGPVYWTAIAWNILFGILYFVVGKRVWYFGKKNNYITPSDFFNDHYGSKFLTDLIAVIMLLFTVPYLQIQLTGGAYLLEVASGGIIPWRVGGLIFYAVIIVYVWAGGLRAVALTDVFYGVLLFFGMIFAGFYVAGKVGGVEVLFQTLVRTAPENLTLPGPMGNAGPMLWVSMFIITPLGAFMGPQLWTRMYAVKSSRLFNLMPFLLGFAAIAYVGSMLVGMTGVILEPGLERADTILPVMLFKYAPFVLASVITACGAAAAMSTANSQIHSMSAVYTVDIHQKYVNTNMDQKSLVWVGRWAILIFAALAYFMSIFIPGLLVNIGLIALSGTAQVIVPTAGALFWKRSTAAGAIAGLLVSNALLAAYTFIPMFTPPFGMHSGLLTLIVNIIVFVVVSSMTKPRDQALMERIDSLKKVYDASY